MWWTMSSTGKPPSDQVRLARAFRVSPTKRVTALSITSTFAAIGALGVTVAFLPAAGLLFGIGAFELADRRTITKGLREVERWGFRVEGYRAWLLADEPAFDTELRGPVGMDVLTHAIAAVDAAIQVRRIDDRTFRVVTRRIALPGKQEGARPIYLGDRRLLGELLERILAPLHADVGILEIRMGEQATLAALGRGPDRPLEDAQPHESRGAFRDAAMVAPPALQALVHQGTTALALDERGNALTHRTERVLNAVGKTPAGVGTVAAVGLGGMVAGAQFGVVGIGLGAVAGLIGGVAMAVGTNRRNLRVISSLASGARDFPLEGYDSWLLSGRPLFELELKAPIDRNRVAERLFAIVAFSGEANAPVRWVEDLQWITDTLVRIETRPTLNQPTSGKFAAFYGGSHRLFQQCLNEVLRPLHLECGIAAVRMGGNLERRV